MCRWSYRRHHRSTGLFYPIIIESDPPELSEEEVDSVLQELAGLLENNDLRAGGEFERLRNMDSDKIDSEALKVIGEYIARLDYAKALGVLKEFWYQYY